MTVTPLSILDLAPISAGSDAPTALRNTIDLARRAEEWGYKRYWLAEHHFVAVASSAPATLIGQIAAATTKVHVGSAAVQVGHTTALAVVESFGILDALYPGRIDMGLGRSGQRRNEATGSRAAGSECASRPWREVDGLVIPAPFDQTPPDEKRTDAGTGVGTCPTVRPATGFRRPGRRHRSDAGWHLRRRRP